MKSLTASAFLLGVLIAWPPDPAQAASPVLTVLAPHKKEKKLVAGAETPAPSPKKPGKDKQPQKTNSE